MSSSDNPITPPVAVKVFPNTGTDFSGYNAAKRWLEERGYVVGDMQRDRPMGVHHSSECSRISKWRHLLQDQRAALHGTLTGKPRSGDMTVAFVTGEDPAIPMAEWGKDHWSTLAFVAYWCEQSGAEGFNIRTKADHMRTDLDLHPELAGRHVAALGRRKYPTRLAEGREVASHDDWSCLEDIEAAGLVRREGTGTQPIIFMTDRGLRVAAELTAHKTGGGNYASFRPAAEPTGSESP